LNRLISGLLVLILFFQFPFAAIEGETKHDTKNKNIYLYFDDEYRNSWISEDDSRVLLNYFVNIFAGLGINSQIVNATELKQVITTESPADSLVIFTRDVVPETVWNGTTNSLIVNWLRSGGIIVWTGDWEFYYIGYKNKTIRHYDGIQDIPFGREVTVPVEANVSFLPEWENYIPGPSVFETERPFSEIRLQGLYYEKYGQVFTGSDWAIDPGLIKIGDGYFLKAGATKDNLDPVTRAVLMTGLTIIRFNIISVKPSYGFETFQARKSGIVYILPEGGSSDYWGNTYGDRIYFYAHANVSDYREDILDDFNVIARNYDHAIVIIPSEETNLYYYNMAKLNEWAGLNNFEIIYAFFSMYGGEEVYLDIGSWEHELLLHNMDFLTNLSSTVACGVWFGDHDRPINVTELQDFYYSLPANVRDKYYVWVDQPFIEDAVLVGLPAFANELNLTVVTELYNNNNLAFYGGWFNNQMIITGYQGASSPEDWVMGMKNKLGYVVQANQDYYSRRMGVWIFWDNDDGAKEEFYAYINGTLRNPLHPGSELNHFKEAYGDNHVSVVYPSQSEGKPLGAGGAMLSDWQASAYITTKLVDYSEGLDTDEAFIDQITGETIAAPLEGIVSFGGPFVNPLVSRAESTETPPSDRAPVKFHQENGTYYFQNANGSSISGAELPQIYVNTDQDLFVIESFRDSEGRYKMLCYGFGWKGTYAAGKYFHSEIYPDLDAFPYNWIIVKWEDTNGDDFVNGPSDNDTYTVIATG
jgi:hypothetical protein